MSATADRHRRIKEAFFEIASLAPEERDLRLIEIAGEDGELATEVRALVEHAEAEEVRGVPGPEETMRDPAPGSSIGPYRLVRRLGEGGMGIVFEAVDSRLERTVAVKLLPAALTRFEPARRRLLREAKAAAALDHPNLCAIHEVAETEDGQVYFAMAYYEGETLRERMRRGPLQVEQAVEIAAQIARGLAHAHERGIVHRDLKPANVLLAADGTVRLLDFGLAKLAGADRLTGTGAAMGTPAYMAPEQIRSSDVDARADLWSLGVLLHEMVTGEAPFRGDHPQALFYSILNDRPEPLSLRQPEAPAGLQAIVDGALRKDPGKRTADAKSLLLALREIVPGAGGSGISWAPSRSFLAVAWSARRRAAVATAAALILAAVAAGLLFWRSAPAAAATPSVAILPFEATVEIADAAALAQGLTEQVGADLGRRSTLQVVAVSPGAGLDVAEVNTTQLARRLGVGFLARGSVEAGEDEVRVDVSLLAAPSGAELWHESYTEPTSRLHLLERRIADGIAMALLGRGPLPAEAADRRPGSSNSEAYALLLKGRYFLAHESQEAGLRALDAALALDPAYADAHAERGRLLGYMGVFGALPADFAYGEGMRAAETALALDPRCSSAYIARGHLRLFSRLDWNGAQRDFERARDLDPGLAASHYSLGAMGLPRNQLDLARVELGRALALDPISPQVHAALARAHFYRREHLEAIAVARAALELQPKSSRASWVLSRALWENGDRLEAAGIAADAGLRDGDSGILREIAAGRPEEARRLLAARPAEWGQGTGKKMPSVWRAQMPAMFAVLLGDPETALAELERMYEETTGPLIFAQAHLDPVWDPVRDDPRFVDLLRRSGAEQQ